jgi:hypothetical protein
MIEESNETGLPKHFKSDLLHDADRLLGDDCPNEFVWVLRECGTHLCAANQDEVDWLEAVLKQHPEALAFEVNVDNEEFQSVSHKDAIAFLLLSMHGGG